MNIDRFVRQSVLLAFVALACGFMAIREEVMAAGFFAAVWMMTNRWVK